MPSSSSFEKIATNYEIIIQIYQKLTFEDQLSLANVSATLGCVFASFVWRENYRTLTIYGDHGDYVVTNAKGLNRVRLTCQGFGEFLRLYAHDVRELNLYRMGLPANMSLFRNLVALRYNYSEHLQLQEIKLVAENLQQLESFHLYGWPSIRHDDYLTIGKNLSLGTLLKMGQLKQFSLHTSTNIYRTKYENFRKIIDELNVEYLKLSSAIEPEGEVVVVEWRPTNRLKLKELDFKTSFDPSKWSTNFTSFLATFENLTILAVTFTDEVTDEILHSLAVACKSLEKFTIRQTTFAKVAEFALPPTVTEINLQACRNLQMYNLQQLLTRNKIRKFVSHNTRYQGAFEDFRISPFVEILDLDGVDMCTFKSAYAGNRHLKELTWHHTSAHGFPSIVTGMPLASCVNLEVLHMKDALIELDSLLPLQLLRALTLPFLKLQWPYMAAILKHCPLRELLIDKHIYMSCREVAAGAPHEGFSTNVRRLQLHVAIFESTMHFWLDLLCRNRHMALEVWNFTRSNLHLLLEILNHRNFPKSLRTIDVFGFTIECNDLRRDFDNTVERLQPNNDKHVFINRIVLCRN